MLTPGWTFGIPRWHAEIFPNGTPVAHGMHFRDAGEVVRAGVSLVAGGEETGPQHIAAASRALGLVPGAASA